MLTKEEEWLRASLLHKLYRYYRKNPLSHKQYSLGEMIHALSSLLNGTDPKSFDHRNDEDYADDLSPYVTPSYNIVVCDSCGHAHALDVSTYSPFVSSCILCKDKRATSVEEVPTQMYYVNPVKLVLQRQSLGVQRLFLRTMLDRV